jgi:N-acetyl-gamma-glutamyl-phosphate reductase
MGVFGEAQRRVAKTAGVFGATGYSGREIVRLLAVHPEVRIAFATGSGSGYLPHESGLEREADAYFLALPHGISARYAATLGERFPRAIVVDLSGDLRLPTDAAYREWYGHDHPAPSLLGQVPYGLTEVFRDRLPGARLISNPGCYATSVLLPLLPLLRARLVDADDVIVDAKSGASGAGRSLREDLLFCELQDNFSAYSPGRTHRHVGEMEPLLAEAAGAPVALTFCPHLLPVNRGILSALYLKTHHEPAALAAALVAFYGEAGFVRVVAAPPRLSDVQNTNDCLLSVHAAAPGRVVVFSALDNLVKGAAGQAIQNLNVAVGWNESLGLPTGLRSPAKAEAAAR